jgi:copper chaperone
MESVTYFVPRIHCGHCVHTIQMELSELEGVRSVQASESSRKVAVAFGPPATREKIEARLREIEYPPEPLVQL